MSAQPARAPGPHGVTTESPIVRGLLILTAAALLLVLVGLPLFVVFASALGHGLRAYLSALRSPEASASIRLTLLVVAIAVPANLGFGLAAAWVVGKFRFFGRGLLVTLIDLPLAVSPVVAGLVYVFVFGRQGLLGPWLERHDLHVIFAVPGIVLATIFVTFPIVAREVLPLMEALGSHEEEAALTLGAGGWQTFFRITLPKVRWGVLYGVILCNARAMGEFGAVSVVSGHILGRTNTMPLAVEALYNDYDLVGAFAVASLLTLLAVATLLVKKWIEWRSDAGGRA
ncbi:MAG TPA: sulfate ABC transporter permease subunit CysW [Polyangia bacterium]|nr:sulfate ABC transporter permease subunit CysW [Polyangia bacterium]